MAISPAPISDNPSRALQELSFQKLPLVLTSSYKGLVLNQELKIIEFGRNTVILQAPNNRICVSLKGHTYLYSPSLPEVIVGQIDDLNIEQGKIIVSHLIYTGSPWKERLNERIQPLKPVYVDVQLRKSNFRAELENLSANGMKLMAYKLFEKGISIDIENAIRINFSLPGENNKLDVKGSIVYIRQVGRLEKFGVRMFPTASQAAHIRLYIAARMAEILDELDQECIDTHEQIGAQYLYF